MKWCLSGEPYAGKWYKIGQNSVNSSENIWQNEEENRQVAKRPIGVIDFLEKTARFFENQKKNRTQPRDGNLRHSGTSATFLGT